MPAMRTKLPKRAWSNIFLILFSFVYIFVIGLFEESKDQGFAYQVIISFIYIFSFLTIKEESNFSFTIPGLMVILTWLGSIFDFHYLSRITGLIATIFFFAVIVLLILRIANSRKVRILEFVESVNIYLLLGIAASVLFKSVYAFNHEAYNTSVSGMDSMSDFIYFAFVTMTTLGYGDISPAGPLARSLAIFFSVAGQLYLTMIIAMLVGKYLGEVQEKK
jgi:hypothetical protein